VEAYKVDEKLEGARRRALERELSEQLKDLPPMRDRTREMNFFARHPELVAQLLDQWVALDGDELICHGPDATDVVRQAWALGYSDPYVKHVHIRDPKIAWIF